MICQDAKDGEWEKEEGIKGKRQGSKLGHSMEGRGRGLKIQLLAAYRCL